MISGHLLNPFRYLLSTHPIVHLLTVTVEEVQVQALLILMMTPDPQFLQGSPVFVEYCHLWKGRDNVHRRYFIN